MLQTLLHEPTDVSGLVDATQSWLEAGWAAHQGSFAGVQTSWNEERNVCLLFAGECFADQADLDYLAARGHAFDRGNASYLVHQYEDCGPSFLARLNGIFAGLLIDQRESKAVLFNDRYGLGRIYCHERAEGFYFASEAKAILKVLPHLRRLDSQSFGEFFACGCVLQNRTLFPGITLLPGGSAWTFRPGQPVKKENYFDKSEWEGQPRLAEADYYDRLKATFARILPRYFRDADRVAMSMTGGLDSRMVMAWTGQLSTKLPCYSHRGMFHECADARVARRVAAVCHQSHREVRVAEEFLADFPRLARQTVAWTDGAMDVSGAAGLYANRVAGREIAPIRMTGNYGGEILRGIVALSRAKLNHPYFSPDFAARIEAGRATLAAEKQGNRTSLIAFKQVPWHHYARFAMESTQLTIRSPYLDNDLVKLAYQAPADMGANQRLAARLIRDGNPALAAFPTDRGPLGRSGFLGRLDERFQEFTFKADYAYDYGMPHWLVNVDRWLAPLHLERLFLGRHKYYHFRYWYRTALAPFVQEVLLDPRSLARPYFDRAQVERMVHAHVTGRGNYTLEIHALLTTELIHRELLEPS